MYADDSSDGNGARVTAPVDTQCLSTAALTMHQRVCWHGLYLEDIALLLLMVETKFETSVWRCWIAVGQLGAF